MTILDPPPVGEARERGRRMKEALLEISTHDALPELGDPAQWERDLRQDRPLPGRET